MYPTIKRLHFIGIGGIGMSGIAELLLTLGYQVSGSDAAENANVVRLRKLGATIRIGHHRDNVTGADAVVFSSAIPAINPEMEEARRQRIPRVPRAEMLAELMRLKYGIAIAGTHGKTTTTSLIATLLSEAGLDPTVVNGGIVKAFGSNARLGQGAFLVTESDESDGSFLKLTPTIAVVTNIDPEHMEHYKQFDNVRDAFRRFVEKVPFYGLVVLCHDHPEVRALLPRLTDKRVVTYGLEPGADLQAVDVEQQGIHISFRVRIRDTGLVDFHESGPVTLSPPGRHNVLNTLAAIAVARELGIPWPVITRGVAQFKGVQRRFDILQEGPERVVIDDYAHHPVEIAATLAAVRACYGPERRLVAVFQPHRYSRVRDLLVEFTRCFGQTNLVVVDRIYPAGESPLPGLLADGGQEDLVPGIHKNSGVETVPWPAGPHWMVGLNRLLRPGDVVVFLGAGDISRRARDFVSGAGE
ncbi:MAG: UDP-N-acetylmuramate--L-alanine ligase [Magnetococcales bacterium]|nr:UDP-N-acetylmuramate--L-alanine ligase [Magnetococcales bacterium]